MSSIKKYAIMIALIAILLPLNLLLTGCPPALREYSETREMMSTFFTITVLAGNEREARAATESAFSEISRIEGLMSHTDKDSEVYELNRRGYINNPSEDLFTIVLASQNYSERTDGAFDITVQPLLELYTHTYGEEQRPPTEDEINDSLELVGYTRLRTTRARIYFDNESMKITLGGIAKGYALDRAEEKIQSYGISSALLTAGGQIKSYGTKNGQPWTIALRNPRDAEKYVTKIFLESKEGISVSTSGDYERFFDESKTAHHIMDPKTGRSATDVISATIIAPRGIDADALSTAVFVLGPFRGMELIEQLDDVEGLIITAKREILRSSGFAAYETP